MSTKTWQEKFEEEFWGKFGSTKTINEIKQFISQAIDQIREETLAVPYNVSEWKRIGQERKYWDYFKQDIREEIIRVAMERIEQIKSAIAKNTGSYKYDSCYDNCLNVLQSLINLRSK